MKYIWILAATLSLISCTKNANQKEIVTVIDFKTGNRYLADRTEYRKYLTNVHQIVAYSDVYTKEVGGWENLLLRYEKQQLVETLHFDKVLNRIGRTTYSPSIVDQFQEIVEANPEISYVEAKQIIDKELINYFSEDCPSIASFLSRLDDIELDANLEEFQIELDSPRFEYYYKDHSGLIDYNIKTNLVNHPVASLYTHAMKAIEQCPHPTQPPHFDYNPLDEGIVNP